jgi:hypothetical protein
MPIYVPGKLTLRQTWQPMDPDAAAYITAVETADGQALEEKVKIAIDNFVLGCKADGIWSAIKASCILAGARTLSGALVPLAGTAPTNYNFVAGDYDRETGLAGNNTTKYLDSGTSPAEATLRDSAHLSVYTSSAPDISLAGSLVASPQSYTWIRGDVNYLINAASSSVGPTPGPGFIGIARSSNTKAIQRSDKVSTELSSLSVNPNSTPIAIFARSISGSISEYSTSRIAFYSIGESLDLARLDARVTDLINAIGAAIP